MLKLIAEEYEDTQIKLKDKDDELSLKLSLDDVETKIKRRRGRALRPQDDPGCACRRTALALSHTHIASGFPTLAAPLPCRTQAPTSIAHFVRRRTHISTTAAAPSSPAPAFAAAAQAQPQRPRRAAARPRARAQDLPQVERDRGQDGGGGLRPVVGQVVRVGADGALRVRDGRSSLLGQVSGVIKKETAQSLERVLFRATRGNAVFETFTIEQELLDVDNKGSNESVEKVFFMVLFAGEVMREKISKICSYFGASLYKYPESSDDYASMMSEVERRLVESDEILAKGEEVRRSCSSGFAATYLTWAFVVSKEKMVFDTLNMCEFDIKRHVFVAEGWVPSNKYEVGRRRAAGRDRRVRPRHAADHQQARLAADAADVRARHQVHLRLPGPRQHLRHAALPRVQPGRLLLHLLPLPLRHHVRRLRPRHDARHVRLLPDLQGEGVGRRQGLNDMVQMCYGGRYIILLNGLFGAYVGLLYNEAFAFPMSFFGGSRWYNMQEDPSRGLRGRRAPRDPDVRARRPVYPVGIDPIWHYSANKITFFNSFKMKISIVVGVIQMSVGICLSLLNHIEYKDYKRIFFEYLPEMIFFEGIFGYLVFCIFYKWSVDWNGDVGVPGNPGPQVAPSLLTLLINMFMSPTTDITVPLYGIQCYTDCGSAAGKCYIARSPTRARHVRRRRRREGHALPGRRRHVETKLCFSESSSRSSSRCSSPPSRRCPSSSSRSPSSSSTSTTGDGGSRRSTRSLEDEKGPAARAARAATTSTESFSFGDAFIHQAIHTIEFVLGSISNTASYLRLWALSLAHSQLAELFKDMVLTDIGLKNGLPFPFNGLAAWFAFAAWAVISLVVLMVMENLSSFLHALRLQWVEFQNKFYVGHLLYRSRDRAIEEVVVAPQEPADLPADAVRVVLERTKDHVGKLPARRAAPRIAARRCSEPTSSTARTA